MGCFLGRCGWCQRRVDDRSLVLDQRLSAIERRLWNLSEIHSIRLDDLDSHTALLAEEVGIDLVWTELA